MMVLGIVGPIGSGKSVVARMLAELGAEVIQADSISRELVEPGSPTLARIAAEFGECYVDDQARLKRKDLARLIFSDDSARERLNAIMYPAMLGRMRELIAQRRAAGCEVLVLEAAVLEPMGAIPLTDRVVMVTAPEAVRCERLTQREGLSAAEAADRIALQRRIGLEATRADFTISTDCSLECVRAQVLELWRAIACDPQAGSVRA